LADRKEDAAMTPRLAPYAFALAILVFAGSALTAVPAAAIETLQKADMLKLRLDLAAFAARTRSTSLDAKLTTKQAETLKRLGANFGKTGDAAPLLRGWRAYVTTAKPAETEVNALVQWVLRQSYVQAAADLKAQVDRVKGHNAGKAKPDQPGDTLGKDEERANLDLQNVMQKQQQTLKTVSSVSKQMHDTAMAIIRKIGG
jgi:hypothetical protein